MQQCTRHFARHAATACCGSARLRACSRTTLSATNAVLLGRDGDGRSEAGGAPQAPCAVSVCLPSRSPDGTMATFLHARMFNVAFTDTPRLLWHERGSDCALWGPGGSRSSAARHPLGWRRLPQGGMHPHRRRRNPHRQPKPQRTAEVREELQPGSRRAAQQAAGAPVVPATAEQPRLVSVPELGQMHVARALLVTDTLSYCSTAILSGRQHDRAVIGRVTASANPLRLAQQKISAWPRNHRVFRF